MAERGGGKALAPHYDPLYVPSANFREKSYLKLTAPRV